MGNTTYPKLAGVIAQRIDQARLIGWRPGRRVTIDLAGDRASLVMAWVTADGSAMIPSDPADPTVAGEHVIQLDSDLPDGVTAQGWSALPDTTDEIGAPDEAEIAEAARALGCSHYERLDLPDGRRTYRMVGVGTEVLRDRLRRCGTILYGDRWQSDLARALNVNDRRVRQWIAGERPIPAGIWADIAALLRQRQQEALALLDELEDAAAYSPTRGSR